MDIREKLAELLEEARLKYHVCMEDFPNKYNDIEWYDYFACHLIANGVMMQGSGEQSCESCRGAVQTNELFEVINPHGVKVYVQFNYCPICGRKLH